MCENVSIDGAIVAPKWVNKGCVYPNQSLKRYIRIVDGQTFDQIGDKGERFQFRFLCFKIVNEKYGDYYRTNMTHCVVGKKNVAILPGDQIKLDDMENGKKVTRVYNCTIVKNRFVINESTIG
ncbi:unnamed protein product, partial [Mesorhabditis belari]|uniref:Uncharacterized protein n=1 Tax=Mesorhabditis belari TaxID=2138241 RepID=A0AAF3FKC3_9BILA